MSEMTIPVGYFLLSMTQWISQSYNTSNSNLSLMLDRHNKAVLHMLLP